jgi:hypothetical protein
MLDESDLSNVADRTDGTSPPEPTSSAPTRESGENRDFSRVVLFAFVQPLIVGTLWAMFISCGPTLRVCEYAGLLSWASVVVIVLRQVSARRGVPTRVESWVAKFGFWAALFLGLCVFRQIGF